MMEYLKECMNLKRNIHPNNIENFMDINRYNELYNNSKITKLSYEDQEELLKISTQILVNLLKSDVVVQEALDKLQTRYQL